MPATAEDKGGMVKGPSHAKGGVKFIVDGRLLEAEGGEPVIPGEIMADGSVYEFTGTHLQILDQINEKFGARSMDEKAKVIEAGDIIICKISAADQQTHTYKGTLTEIVSEINQSGGCKPIYNMHNEEQSCGCDHMEQGGLVKKLEKGERLVVNRWEDLPETYRVVKKVNDVTFLMNPYDKGLLKILSPFVGEDALRPVATGVHFNEHGCSATDMHKLIFIPGKSEYSGTYCTTASCIKIRGKALMYKPEDSDYKGDLVTVNYPAYANVFPPNSSQIYPLDLLKLKTYCESVINARLTSTITKQFIAKVGDNAMGFNQEFIVELCTSLMMLGHRHVYAGFREPNNAMVISPDKEALEHPSKSINKNHIMTLIMPLMVNDYTESDHLKRFGAWDLDWERYSNYYFDFTTNEIRNSDGEVALFDEDLVVPSDNVVNSDQYELLKMVVKKASGSSLPVLDYVTIQHNIAMATTLEATVLIHKVSAIEGMYLPLNGDLLIEPSASLSNRVQPPSEKDRNRIGTFSRSEFLFHLSIAAKCVGKDELRPHMNGVNIYYDENERVVIQATDAHIAYRNEMVNCDFDRGEKLLFGDIDILLKALKISDTEIVEVFSDKHTVWFNMHNVTVVLRQIDARYPELARVFPKSWPKSALIDANELRKCMNGVSKAQRKQGRTNIILSSEESGKMKVIAAVYDSKHWKEKDEAKSKDELCTIDFANGETGDYENFGLLVMPVMEGANGLIMAYNLDILEYILELVPDFKVTIEYSEPNRASRFSGEHAKNFWHPDNLGPHIAKLQVKGKSSKPVSHNSELQARKDFAESEYEILKAMMPKDQKQVAAKGGVASCM